MLSSHGLPGARLDEPKLREVQEAVADVTNESLSAMADELARTISYLRDPPLRLISATDVAISAGAGAVRNVAESLTAKIGVPSRGWRLASGAARADDGDPATLFGVAAALSALAWMNLGVRPDPGLTRPATRMKTYINLLPRGYRRSKLLWLPWQWSALWAAGPSWASVSRSRRTTGTTRAGTPSTAATPLCPVSRLQTEIGDLEAQVKELAAREKSLEWLGADRPALALLRSGERERAQFAGQVTVEKLSLKPLAAGAATPTLPADTSHTLTLQGVGLDNLAVARFVVALRETSAPSKTSSSSPRSSKVPLGSRPASTSSSVCFDLLEFLKNACLRTIQNERSSSWAGAHALGLALMASVGLLLFSFVLRAVARGRGKYDLTRFALPTCRSSSGTARTCATNTSGWQSPSLGAPGQKLCSSALPPEPEEAEFLANSRPSLRKEGLQVRDYRPGPVTRMETHSADGDRVGRRRQLSQHLRVSGPGRPAKPPLAQSSSWRLRRAQDRHPHHDPTLPLLRRQAAAAAGRDSS